MSVATRLAAVDVGSNAIRFLAIGLGPTGAVIAQDTQRYPLRLGSDVFAGGAIGPANADRCLQVFHDIATRLQSLQVDRYRAVATAAMRDAANAAEIIGRIHAETGVTLEIISGTEESRLARRALLRAVGSAQPGTLLIDLGGGSLEVQWAKSGQARSLPFGGVRLLEAFPVLLRPMQPDAAESLCATIHEELRRHIRWPRKANHALGTGGNLTALAGMVPDASHGVPAMSLAALPELMARVAPMSVAERVLAFGVREDRADVLLPAIMVLRGLARLYGLNMLAVPDTGLRESILHELAVAPRVRSSARRALRAVGADFAAADRLAALARELFWSLTPLHGLWAPGIGPLQLAAYFLTLETMSSVSAPDLLSHLPAELLPQRALITAVEIAARLAGPGTWRALADQLGALHVEDERPADLLAALLGLAAALQKSGAHGQPRVDLLSDRPVIDAGLPQPLADAALAPLQRALQTKIRVC